ncbi:hypothetical protein [Sphaerisporangium sp. NPDC051011]|uniref:hypothetical protein n=1 Tax=Sphaerisporangium sp. NPDC051011 TaxID=3155792 RepID=UPI0033CF9979
MRRSHSASGWSINWISSVWPLLLLKTSNSTPAVNRSSWSRSACSATTSFERIARESGRPSAISWRLCSTHRDTVRAMNRSSQLCHGPGISRI